MRIPPLIIVLAVGALFALGVFVWPAPFNNDTVSLQSNTETLSPIERTPRTIVFDDGTEATFAIAEPFTLTVAAEGLGKARFMSWSPDARLFVPDLVDYNLSHQGRIFILEDFDEETGTFQTKHTYLSGLRGVNSVEFYTDADGKDWIYIALTAHLLRYPYQAGDTAPTTEPEIITTFPNTQTPGETSVVWHITRTLLFHDDELYIAIGSGCNSCEQLEGELRGMVMVMDPDGSNARVYAGGLRNAVGITWAGDSLYATANGVDHLGPDAPDEVMYKIDEGAHYGWPYCYELGGVPQEDTTGLWSQPVDCKDVPHSFASFPPRSAPLGLTYFEDAHPVLENTFLVALHGSFDASMGTGYQVIRVSKDGAQDVFMEGFLTGEYERVGRPVHFLQKDERSFFMTDDYTGSIYYVRAP